MFVKLFRKIFITLTKKANILILFFWLIISLIIYYLNIHNLLLSFPFHTNTIESVQIGESIPGCVMTKVDPFDEFVLPLIVKLNFTCPKQKPLTILDSNDVVRIEEKENHFNCYYSWINRLPGDKKVSYSDVHLIADAGLQLTNQNYVVNVSCFRDNQLIYENIHLKIPSYAVPARKVDITEKPNVFILVIESLGHLSYQRFMPKLEAIIDKIGNFHTFNAVNRVGENSLPNSAALIAGESISDQMAASQANTKWDNKLPFIWSEFKENNYLTAFLEDNPMLGIFSFYNRSFHNQPTDFYPVQFWLHIFSKWKQLATSLLTDYSNYCWKNITSNVDIYLDICTRFGRKFQFEPFFMFAVYGQMTHENFNNLQLIDEPLAKFLHNFNSVFAENTIFLLIGDHGIRQGSYSDSPMGRMEASLPFMAIRIPDNLHRKHPHLRKYLSINENRLTTMFDVHKTLQDIGKGKFEALQSSLTISSTFSIMREEIPINRTCKMAKIPSEFCACNGKVGINLQFKTHHVIAVREAIDNLKYQLRKLGFCMNQNLHYYRSIKGFYLFPGASEKWSLNERINASVLVKPSLATINFVASRSRKLIADEWGKWIIETSQLLNYFTAKKLAEKVCTRHKSKSTIYLT